ncbi:MAG: FAD-dependent oxidoreductase [Lysobacter sp.]|nr:FAD-dependent oxidoreductase [Lysobacter sp.]
MTASGEGGTTSLWMATAAPPAFAPLREDTHADVCIVGAGIAGLTTAYRLALEGRDVVVVEERDLCGGQTARTTGHLCSALDDRFFQLEAMFGEDGARLAAQSHAAAVDTIQDTARNEGIDCDFERIDGYLVRGFGDRREDVLEREFVAARRAGLHVERVAAGPDAFAHFGPALRFHDQARFHALRYLGGLAEAVVRHGGRIHCGTRVEEIEGGRGAGVATNAGPSVHADAVVIASHVPFNDRLAVHTKQAAYRTYVLALRIAHDAVPDALLWDTLDPYHYVRIAHEDDGSWLIVGGEDRKSGQDDTPRMHFRELEAWTREHFPMAGPVGYCWSGHIIEPVDSLAFIGHNPGLADNVFIATGDSGNGLTHGTIAGLLLADLIAGRRSPWKELYEPDRKPTHALGDYARENASFLPFYGERLGAGAHEDIDALVPGEAAVVRHHLGKVAAWRDMGGMLHLHSAVCPHLGCVVHWNPVERSWDCPCHGSRFDAHDGSVLNGPADRGLTPLSPELRASRHSGSEPRSPLAP